MIHTSHQNIINIKYILSFLYCKIMNFAQKYYFIISYKFY
jgi:hypothetical protein